MSYQMQAVYPRDFFNISKLLKCMGQLSLLIHDNKAPKGLKFVEIIEGELPKIKQNEDDAALYCYNILLFYNCAFIDLRCQYNSKANFPLLAEGERVFTDSGEFHTDFLDLLKTLK